MRSGEERGDRPESFHQVSDQTDLKRLRKTHSKHIGDGRTDRRTDRQTNRPTDRKVSYRDARMHLKTHY